MSFIKTFLIFCAIDAVVFAFRFFSSLMVTFFEKKLNQSVNLNSGKHSSVYMFFALFFYFILILFNCILSSSILLLILYRWDKAFSIGLVVVSIISFIYSFYSLYSAEKDMINDYGKRISAFIPLTLVTLYISDWIINFSSFTISVAFETPDIVRAIIHMSVLTVFIILNFVYLCILIKSKNTPNNNHNYEVY